jgi:hypothetical protein
VGLFEVGSGLALRKSSNSTVRKSDGRIDAIRAGWSLFAPAGRQCPVRHTALSTQVVSCPTCGRSLRSRAYGVCALPKSVCLPWRSHSLAAGAPGGASLTVNGGVACRATATSLTAGLR